MTTMSDLPEDLAEEIFSRVPLTSLSAVRSTCKNWNAFSKNRILGKAAARKQLMGFMMKDYRVCSMRFDLQGIRNKERDFVDPSIKQVALLDQVQVSEVFHCDGLLLCVTKDKSGLLVWNPYLGQTRWIQPRDSYNKLDRYALGYDKNRNHKILRISGDYGSSSIIRHYLVFRYEIYDLRSSSWKAFDVNPDWQIEYFQRGVSLKGNAYVLARDRAIENGRATVVDIVSFDFTREMFGQRLHLPFVSHDFDNVVSVSSVRDEQLAVLHQSWVFGHALEIWVTDKIDPGAVSWSKYLSSLSGGCKVDIFAGSFFVDEEKKVAVVVDLDDDRRLIQTRCNQTATIIGQDGYFKSVNIGKCDETGITYPSFCRPLVCSSSSYVPSSVQLEP